MKAVIYQKMLHPDPSSSDFDPFDIELHYWTVDAETKSEAIDILEKRWDVPWRDWLVEVIDFADLEAWKSQEDMKNLKLIRHR